MIIHNQQNTNHDINTSISTSTDEVSLYTITEESKRVSTRNIQ